MMLIIVTAIVAALGIVICWYGDRKYNKGMDMIGFFIGTIASIVLFTEIVLVVILNVGTAGKIASYESTYEVIVYQIENNIYDNDNDIGKESLYNQIQDWNAEIARGKAMQHDIWVGVFVPNIYDQFELIELEALHENR